MSERNKKVNTKAAAHQCSGSCIKKAEAAVRRCSSKWVFLKNLPHSEENTCVEVSF